MVAPNDILGYYRLIERIGAGGMGEVWKAEDARLGRIVAVKILPAKVANDNEAIARLRREARAAAQINHPNIATIYSFEEIGERLFIVMEYVEGEPLTRLIEKGPVPEADLCRIGRSVAEALQEAHAKGIVHRDIKPDNIIVNGPRVKVLDFGIAKQIGPEIASNDPTAYLTQQGMILGTVYYMSPEQALGKPLDGRSDIFSLGVVMYQAATGRLPFHGETVTETITQIVRDQPPDPGTLNRSLSPNFTRILGRCLRKPKDQRFATAAELAAALDAQLSRASTAPVTEKAAVASPTVLTTRKPVAKATPPKKWIWIAIAAAAVLAIAAAALFVMTRRTPPVSPTVPVSAAPVKPESAPTPAASTMAVTAAPDTSVTVGTSGTTATAAPTAVAPTVTQPPPPATAEPAGTPAGPTADQLYVQGLSALQQRQLMSARDSFSAAVARDPHYARAHMRLGEIALLARDAMAARVEFRQALDDVDRLDPREQKISHLGLAIANANWPRARQLADELYQANPSDPDLAAFRRLVEEKERAGAGRPRRFKRP